MAAPTKPWTRADLARLPRDGNRYEVLDGRLLVTPQAGLPHQRVAAKLLVLLDAYARRSVEGIVVAPGSVSIDDGELQPDVQVIPRASGALSWDEAPRPILVVEVLSDSTRRRDFGIKREAYLTRADVPAVWLVDWERREVHVCESGTAPHVERDHFGWRAPGAVESLDVDVVALFRDAIGPAAG